MRAFLSQLFVFIFAYGNLFGTYSGMAWAQQYDLFEDYNPSQNSSSTDVTARMPVLGSPSRSNLVLDFDPQTGRLELPRTPEGIINNVDFIDDRTTEEAYRNYSPRELRAQYHEIEKQMSMVQSNRKGSRIKTAFHHANMSWGKETVYFQIVLGAIAVHQTMARHAYNLSSGIDEHGKNPVAYQLFWDSLKDPVAHLSFYSFMVANRLTADWLMDRMTPTPSKQMFLKLFVPGVSMSAGSIVSHLTHQAFATFKSCVTDLHKKGRQRTKLGLSYYEPKKAEAELKPDACDQAWELWTKEKLFYSLAPSVTSMLLATLTGGLATWLTKTLLYEKKVDKVTGRIKLTARSGIRNSRLEMIKAVRKMHLKGLNWRFVFSKAGGPVTTLVSWGAKLGHIGVFLVASEKFMDGTERVFGNIFKGSYFGYLVPGKNMSQMGLELDGIMAEPARLEDWARKANEYLMNLNTTAGEWRKVNNATVEKYHGMWMEKTTNFLTSVRMAKQFYANLIDDMKLTETQRKIPISADNIQAKSNNFAKRTYPFYLVKPLPNAEIYPNTDETANFYFRDPDHIEEDQMKAIVEHSKQFCQDIKNPAIDKQKKGREVVNELCKELSSGERSQMTKGLLTLNKYVLTDAGRGTHSTGYIGDIALKLLKDFRTKLGDPRPLLYPLEGYAYAWEVYGAHRAHAETFPDTRMGRYKREKIADYMMYKMVCGSENNQQMIKDKDGWKIEFNPPKIVTVQSIKTPHAFCVDGYQPGAGDNRSVMIYREKFATDRGDYDGIGNLVLSNMKPEVLGLINSTEEASNMNVWWEQAYGKPIFEKFEKLQKEYRPIAKKLVENLFQDRSKLNFGPSQNSITDIIAQEVRVNMMMQAELLKTLIATNPGVATKNIWASKEIINDLQRKFQPDSPLTAETMDNAYRGFGKTGIFFLQNYLWAFDYNVIQAHKNKKPIPEPQVFMIHANAQRLLMNQVALFGGLEVQKDGVSGKVVNVVNTNDAEHIKTYDEQVGNLETQMKELFKQFKMGPAQAQLVEITTTNIKRLLAELHTYFIFFKGLESDTVLTEENAAKKAPKPTRVGPIK